MNRDILKTKDDKDKKMLIVHDTSLEAFSNKSVLFKYEVAYVFCNTNLHISLYVHKETEIAILEVYSRSKSDNCKYVYLHNCEGERKIDHNHFNRIGARLDDIFMQSEPYEISIEECLDFIILLDHIHTKVNADVFLDESGEWSLDFTRIKIKANKQFKKNILDYDGQIASLYGQEAHEEAHTKAIDVAKCSSDYILEKFKYPCDDEAKKIIDLHSKRTYEEVYARTYASVIFDTQ